MREMKRKTWIHTGLLVAIFMVLLCAPARADDGYEAPKIENKIPWRAVAVTAVCVVGLCLSVLKNSRRSHQNSA